MTDLPENNKKCIFCGNAIEYVMEYVSKREGYIKPPGTVGLVGMPIGSTYICKNCAKDLFTAMNTDIKNMMPAEIDHYIKNKNSQFGKKLR